MRLTILAPYATPASNSNSTSRTSSPKSSMQLNNTRRGSLGGSLSAFLRSASPTSSALAARRRTVYGDGSWGTAARGGVFAPFPEELADALESFVDSVTIQTTISPLPPQRPLVVLVPVMNVSLQQLVAGPSDSTPSALCFPAPAETLPAISPLDRALAHLRRAKRELEELAEDLSQIVLLAYSSTEHLTGNVAAAAAEQGAKGILTPPFTPEAVLNGFATALKVQPRDFAPTLSQRKSSDANTTFASLAQYALPSHNPPPVIRIPTLPKSARPPDGPFTPMRAMSQDSNNSYDYRFGKPLPPLPPVDLPTPITRKRTSFASVELSDHYQHGIEIKVKVHTTIDPVENLSELPPVSPPTVTVDHEDAESQSIVSSAETMRLPFPTILPPVVTLQPPPAQEPLPPLTPPDDVTPPQPELVSSTSEPVKIPSTTPYADPISDYIAAARRRSVDTGGLALALKAANEADGGLFGLGKSVNLSFGCVHGGWGWGGWEDIDSSDGPLYAELLSDMYLHTQITAESASSSPASMPPPSSHSRRALIRQLSRWDFEPHNLTPDELLECASILFEGLFRVEGMLENTGVRSHTEFLPFLSAVRAIYHERNKYHNFQHAIDVLQAVYSFLVQAECVPPITLLEDVERSDLTLPLKPAPQSGFTRTGLWRRNRTGLVQEALDNLDLLALCIAAIGHDVGHPGLSNAFMKNARTPLSIVYDDKSALEQMHCALLFQLMRKHGLGHLIATPTEAPGSGEFRKLLLQTVLITDMSLHFEWIGRLGNLAQEVEAGLLLDHSRKSEIKLMLCQAIIKCGDISNPTRPHVVSEHWSSALLEEWSCQANLERELGLPVSVVASADEVVQAKGQVGFIDLFTKPLFDTTSKAVPPMNVFAKQGDMNRAQWQKRLEVATTATNPRVVAPLRQRNISQDSQYQSVFPMSLPSSLITPYSNPSPPRTSHWPVDEEDDSITPTLPSSAPPPRDSRAHSSVSSTSSIIASPSLTSSTAASSPASHSRSIPNDVSGHTPTTSDPQTTPVRRAYNASVRRKQSYHRISWDPQWNNHRKSDPTATPLAPSLPIKDPPAR